MTPDQVLITPDVAGEAFARAIAAAVGPERTVITAAPPDPGTPPWRILRVMRFQGGLVKEVRARECARAGRREAYLACGVNCPGRCAYCFLGECASVPYPVVYGNLDAMLAELRAALDADPGLYLHLGHIMDALAYPFLAPLVAGVVGVVADYPRATLEIRTKFARPEMLPDPAPPNVVAAFSFSPQRVVKAYERGTSSLEARLAAAARAAARGYGVGIRLDPVILYDGWRQDQAELACLLQRALPHAGTVDAVCGMLRGPAALIARIRDGDPSFLLRRGEFVALADGKYGYPRPMRIAALRWIVSRLGGRFPAALCGEDDSVARAVFARAPAAP